MIATVLKISKDTVVFTPEMAGSCFGCMKQECEGHVKHFTAKNTLGFKLSVGQRVEIETPKTSLLSEGLMVFFPPIAGFISGYLITAMLFPFSGDPIRALGGLFALVVAGFAAYFIKKRLPEHNPPKVKYAFVAET